MEKYRFGFVLDLQHVYENDSTMKLAEELISLWGNRLKHMHVSGCTKSEIHFPTYKSDNKVAITKILRRGINVPKIMEGVLLENIGEEISQELKFIKQFEK